MARNRRNIVIGSETWNKLQKLSVKEERSISDLIRQAIHEMFTKREVLHRGDYNPVTDKRINS